MHVRERLPGRVELARVTAGDEHRIAARLELTGQLQADAAGAPGDEDGLLGKLHGWRVSWAVGRRNVNIANNVVKGNIGRALRPPCKLVRMKAPARPYHHGNLREALLEGAESALESGSAARLTLRELSRALGVSHTSPRRHFADKQALLDALAQRGFERFGASLGRAAKDRGQGFDARLTKLARAHVAFALKHPALFALMFEAKHRPGAPAELLAASERALVRPAAIFTEGQASGASVPGDPARLGLVAFAALQGLIAISTRGKIKGIALDVLVGEVIERIILGLRPRP